MILDFLETIFLFGLFGFIANRIAWKKKFYTLDANPSIPISIKYIGGVFGIYLAVVFFISPWLIDLLLKLSSIGPPSLTFLNGIQIFIMTALMLGLFAFCNHFGKETLKKTWKNSKNHPLSDMILGFGMWFLSFPIVTVIGQFFDLLIYLTAGLQNYEQIAVRYLKESLSSVSQTTIALFTIVILAPILEEFLFRATLQNFFKNHVGTKAAILLSAFCFAMFHFSSSQGIGNLSLIASLFVFGCFLGFIYEKRSSLLASIGLHMTFNLISSLRVLFIPEG